MTVDEHKRDMIVEMVAEKLIAAGKTDVSFVSDPTMRALLQDKIEARHPLQPYFDLLCVVGG